MNNTASLCAVERICRRLGQACRELGETVCRALRAALLPGPRLAAAGGQITCFADWGTVGPASPAGGQAGPVREVRVICPACKNVISAKIPKCPLCGCIQIGPACSPCSRLAALVFCIPFGFLGLHRLYVRKFISGLVMPCITITTLSQLYDVETSRFLAIVMLLWVVSDGLYIIFGKFRDHKGYPLVLWMI